MAMTEDWTRPVRDAVKSVLKNRVALAVLAGAIASLIFFLLQVAYYEPALRDTVNYLRFKMGSSGNRTVPRSALLTLFPLRTFLFVGPALLLGAALALPIRLARSRPLAVAAWIYFLCFTFSALVLPHYFYMENMVYGSLLFPAAVLTALALQSRGRWLPWALAVAAVPGALGMQLYVSVPTITPAARMVARAIADHTTPEDIVLTNLRSAQPPFKSSDVHSGKAMQIVSDREILFGFEEVEQLTNDPRLAELAGAPLIFVRCSSRPISPALAEKLQRNGALFATVKLTLPPAELTAAEKIRSFVWYRVMRKGKLAPTGDALEPSEMSLEFYRLK